MQSEIPFQEAETEYSGANHLGARKEPVLPSLAEKEGTEASRKVSNRNIASKYQIRLLHFQ